MHRPHVAALLLLAACSSGEVTIYGTLYESADADADALADGTIQIREDDGQAYGSAAHTDALGEFSALAPGGATIFAEIGGRDDGVTASFTGTTGVGETLEVNVDEHVLYAFSQEDLDVWRDLMDGCPGAGEGGAVLGEVRMSELSQGGEHPLVTTAWVEVEAANGEVWEGCYLDDEGTGWDPDAEWTGETGRFAVFGVPEGAYTLTVRYAISDDYHAASWTPLWVPEDGVAPRFPAWVRWEF